MVPSRFRGVLQCCCVGAALLLASQPPARAQALHTDFASAELADLEPASESIALTDFGRYSLVPCDFLAAPPSHRSGTYAAYTATRVITTPPAKCTTKKSAAPRYHLDTNLDFPTTPSTSDETSSEDGDADSTSSADFPLHATLSFASPAPHKTSYFDALAYEDRTIPHAEGFHWWPALQQSFFFLLIEHGFRIADDPYLR